MIISSFDCVTTRVHQMRFAESHTPVQVKWIVSTTRRLSDSHRGSVCELIARSDNKPIVGITRTEARFIVTDVVDDGLSLPLIRYMWNGRCAGCVFETVAPGIRSRWKLTDFRFTDFPAQRITIQPEVVQRLVQQLRIIADDP